MAGHSKWHNIKHHKAAEDEKRSKMFHKLFKEIVSACRNGGSDPTSNPRVAKAIENARLSSMPKKNIESALKVGVSSSDGAAAQLFEVTGPGGVAMLVECVGQDRKQLVPNIRYVTNHYDSTIGKEGALAWMFDRKGTVEVTRGPGAFAGDAEELAIEVGAENVTATSDTILLVCAPFDVAKVCTELKRLGVEAAYTSIDYLPNTWAKDLTESQQLALQGMVDRLEELDEVSRVTTNVPASDE